MCQCDLQTLYYELCWIQSRAGGQHSPRMDEDDDGDDEDDNDEGEDDDDEDVLKDDSVTF